MDNSSTYNGSFANPHGQSLAEEGETETKIKTSNLPTPKIYACATMWHETRNEMIQLLKSIFRSGITLQILMLDS